MKRVASTVLERSNLEQPRRWRPAVEAVAVEEGGGASEGRDPAPRVPQRVVDRHKSRPRRAARRECQSQSADQRRCFVLCHSPADSMLPIDQCDSCSPSTVVCAGMRCRCAPALRILLLGTQVALQCRVSSSRRSGQERSRQWRGCGRCSSAARG